MDPSRTQSALTDAQLLRILLNGSGRRQVVDAQVDQLLELAGSLRGLLSLKPDTLSSCMGPAGVARVSAALELGRRLHRSEPPRFVRNERDVERWARGRLIELEHEEVWLLCLDGRNRLRSTVKLAQGGIHGCALTPQDVLRPAVRNAAVAIVLVHNHPSGDPTPSPDDLQMTHAVAKASDLLGIALLDHIVVAASGAVSIAALMSWEL